MSLCVQILRNGGLHAVLEAGTDPDHLFDEGQKVFNYLREHYGKYGKLPDVATVETDTKIDIPELADIAEPVDYYIDRIKQRALDKLAAEQTKKQLEALDSNDANKAIEEAQTLLSQVSKQNLAGEIIDDWIAGVDERVAEYEELKKFPGGVTGVPTPWTGINDLTQGMNQGDFWIIVGRPGTGKTWHLTKMSVHAWVSGFHPLIISMEMSRQRMKRRMDAVYARVAYYDFKRGKLGMHIEDQYKEAMESLKGQNPLNIVSRKRVKTTADVSILIEQVQPDVVFIDGIYKLRPGGGTRNRAHWEQTMETVDEIQEIALDKEVPILGTTQFSRAQVKKGKSTTKAGLEDMAFADAIAMNADVILALLSSTELKANDELILKLLKNREDDTKAFTSKFDLNAMDFDQTGEWDDGMGDDDGDVSADY
jgi:replicative DNA helicase